MGKSIIKGADLTISDLNKVRLNNFSECLVHDHYYYLKTKNML